MRSGLELTELFNHCFFNDFYTRLQGLAPEPLYLPASRNRAACIFFTRDYFASALHEVAHWCLAGAGRRQLPDYGYWYHPDGRSAEQQAAFEAVEIKPQAIEWIFSRCADVPFTASADNLNGGALPSPSFEQAIYKQVVQYMNKGLPGRANQFGHTLIRHYRAGHKLDLAEFRARTTGTGLLPKGL